MSTDHRFALRRALRNVLDVSTGYGFHPVYLDSPTRHPHPDPQLPSPPSLDATLFALGLHANLVHSLSQAYERFALQLRVKSEDSLRRAIRACSQFNSHPQVPAFDSHSFLMVAVDIYNRTLREMASEVITTCQKFAAEPKRPASIRLLRDVYLRDNICVHAQEFCVLPQATEIRQTTKFASANPAIPQNRAFTDSMNTRRMTLNGPDASPPKAREVAVYKMPTNDCTSGTLVLENPHAFPARYVHPEIVASRSLPISSRLFFPNARSGVQRKLLSDRDEASSSNLVAHMKNLALEKSVTHPGEDRYVDSDHLIATPASTPSSQQAGLNPPDVIPRCETFHGSFSHTSRHTLPSSQSPPSFSQSTPVAKASSITPSRSIRLCPPLSYAGAGLPPPPPSVLGSPAGSSTSTLPTRRRKLAPLPLRRPPAGHRDSSETVPRRRDNSTACSASVWSSERSAMSRMPSLVSLASSRSNSPEFSDDGLDTPPSSPPRYTSPLVAPSISLSHSDLVCPRSSEMEARTLRVRRVKNFRRPPVKQEEIPFQFTFDV